MKDVQQGYESLKTKYDEFSGKVMDFKQVKYFKIKA